MHSMPLQKCLVLLTLKNRGFVRRTVFLDMDLFLIYGKVGLTDSRLWLVQRTDGGIYGRR